MDKKYTKLTIAIIFAILAIFSIYKFFSATPKKIAPVKTDVAMETSAGSNGEKEPATRPKQTQTQPATVTTSENSLAVTQQKPGPLATITKATLSRTGFVVIHEDNRGDLGKALASSQLLTKGDHYSIPIPVSLSPGAGYFAVIHADSNDDKSFTPNLDLPVYDVAGNIVKIEFYATASLDSTLTSHVIELKGFAFNPKNLTVKKGDQIIFRNNDVSQHTVTSAAFGGQRRLQIGESFSLNTSNLPAGTYNYVCDFHVTMTGTITIGL